MFWLVFLAALTIDQFTKLIAPTYFELVPNHGISFGWLSQLPPEAVTVALVFFAVSIAYGFRKEWRQNQALAGLFWAGVVSNLLDRILFGGVSDWITLPYIELKNNLADFYLLVALILLLIKELRAGYER